MKRFSTISTILLLIAAVAVPALANDARVRVVHASPGAPSVDILVNDSIRAFEDVMFNEVTDYAELPAGIYNVKVVPAGGDAGDAVFEADLSLFYNTDYTVVAINPLDTISAAVLVDDNGRPSNKQATLRFFHASPDAPPVDIVEVGGPVLFSNISYTETGTYITLPEGIYNVEVRLAGTDTVVLPLTGDLGSRGVYTVYATGFALGGEPALGAALSVDRAPKKSYPRWYRFFDDNGNETDPPEAEGDLDEDDVQDDFQRRVIRFDR